MLMLIFNYFEVCDINRINNNNYCHILFLNVWIFHLGLCMCYLKMYLFLFIYLLIRQLQQYVEAVNMLQVFVERCARISKSVGTKSVETKSVGTKSVGIFMSPAL